MRLQHPVILIGKGEEFAGNATALQRRGIPSEFLTFPDENHWVLKPHNSVEWHDTVNAWLKKWTGSHAAPAAPNPARNR